MTRPPLHLVYNSDYVGLPAVRQAKPCMCPVRWFFIQEAQLSQRHCAMLWVIEYVAKSLKITQAHSKGLPWVGRMYDLYKFLLVFHCNYVYLVPFLRYSASNNGVILQSQLGLGVVYGHWKRRRSIDHVQLTIGWSVALSCIIFEIDLFDVE